MANYSLCLGTAGWGVWHSPDSGQSWTRHRAPFPLNSRIQALVTHPTQPHTVLAGGDTGLFASYDGGARWERVSAEGALPTIWSLTIDPVDPDILFAGTSGRGLPLAERRTAVGETGRRHYPGVLHRHTVRDRARRRP